MDITQVMYGCHAQHVNGQLIFQRTDQVARDGREVWSVVGIVVGFKASEKCEELKAPHELVIGDMVIRPHQKYTGHDHVGAGASGLMKGNAMFPEGWSHQSFQLQ